MYHHINKIIDRIKQTNPLIINITNDVTMEFIANGLLSIGASPIMTKATSEIKDLVNIANSVIINIGTLNDEFLTICEAACRTANELKKPLILDPVGAGASRYRTQACFHLLEQFEFSIIRGNASEIMALCDLQHHTKGVDATTTATTAIIEEAQYFSDTHNIVIVISGKSDVVIERSQLQISERGSSIMPMITGSGCLLTATIGAFSAVYPDRYHAACAAVVFYGVCGELAAEKSLGPGSFKSHFLDTLSQLPNKDDYEQE